MRKEIFPYMRKTMLILVAMSMLTGFTVDLLSAQPGPLTTPRLYYSPIDGGIKLIWDSNAETEDNPLQRHEDFLGYRVYRAQYTTEVWTMIGAFDTIEDSVYVIASSGDTLNDGVPVDLPGLSHTFVDTGGSFLGIEYDRPINGLPYYYAVTAYTVWGFETERDNYRLRDDGTASPVFPTKRYESGQGTSGLENVRVVPNPYKATSLFETRYEDKIMFTNLPPAAEISIFTLDGDLVKTIIHDDGTDSEKWNLVSKSDQFVVSGLYYYVVRTDTEKKIGKFVIMR